MTARPPRRVKLAGHAWTIRRVQLDDELDLFGRTLNRRSEIEISTDQGLDQERNTVLHELLHAIASFVPLWTDSDEEERAVRMLTPWLLAMLRDNRALVAYLTGGEP